MQLAISKENREIYYELEKRGRARDIVTEVPRSTPSPHRSRLTAGLTAFLEKRGFPLPQKSATTKE